MNQIAFAFWASVDGAVFCYLLYVIGQAING